MGAKTKIKLNIDQSDNKHISGAEALARCLLEADANLVYGHPGGAIMSLYDELYKYQDQLHHVLIRHQPASDHAA